MDNSTKIKQKKIKYVMAISYLCSAIVCVVVFVWINSYMTRRTRESISQVSETYLAEMSLQVRQKFTSSIDLYLLQMNAIMEQTPADFSNENEDILGRLARLSLIRSFKYTGFFSLDTGFEIFAGEEYYGKLTIFDQEELKLSFLDNGVMVGWAQNEAGEGFLILGRAAAYQMSDGSKSDALVVGLSMEDFNDALYLYTDESLVYSHIIDREGRYVIRNNNASGDSYYDHIRSELEENGGSNPNRYVQELQEAIDHNVNYTTSILVGDEQRHIYCTPILENTSWYLVTVMPKSILSDSISKLDRLRAFAMIFSALTVLVVTSIVFAIYYRMNRQQMKEAERARKEAVHANQAKSEFLASMSHDIRTPMNAIVGMTEIAMKNMDDQQRLEDCLKKVKLSSKHLIGLINDVLDMAKIESGKMSLNNATLSLKETMDDIVNIVQPQVREKGQYFDIFIQKIIAESVQCDGVRLNQVLLNILSNAIKYTPSGGKVNIFLTQEPSARGESYVRTCFRVRDTGIGMSEEFQKKVFESFSREESDEVRSITGTGLGMAITKHIVDMMGGKIEVQSKLGEGSEFIVTLDMEKSAVSEVDMKLPSWDMLVVDDNEQLCESAVSNLEELGIRAEWALDGQTAVDRIVARHQDDHNYDFVLIDWKMPGMDGLQTIREIRKRVGKELPIFLISAYDWSDIEDDARSEDVRGFISKPLFKSKLFEVLSHYVDGLEQAVKEEETNELASFAGKKVLLAEDIDINYEIAKEILMMTGIELDRAENGQICVDMFNQSEIGHYDLILMDIRMPVMDGYDATRAIRALERSDNDLPIVAMTADAFSNDVQYCLDCGMNAHIAKPLDIKEVMRVLQKYLK